ncbi:hypothetical protein [Streptomyces sp. NPDC002132]
MAMNTSDKDPAEWLPVDGYRCGYGGAWVATKLHWQLPATRPNATL